mmetsp:Transcript_3103/g.4370  ORF Transcript_3103/g.4370 Transcript_3103/m.4370 type:complete len:472 (+) Transcript_3103:157-1572(+)
MKMKLSNVSFQFVTTALIHAILFDTCNSFSCSKHFHPRMTSLSPIRLVHKTLHSPDIAPYVPYPKHANASTQLHLGSCRISSPRNESGLNHSGLFRRKYFASNPAFTSTHKDSSSYNNTAIRKILSIFRKAFQVLLRMLLLNPLRFLLSTLGLRKNANKSNTLVSPGNNVLYEDKGIEEQNLGLTKIEVVSNKNQKKVSNRSKDMIEKEIDVNEEGNDTESNFVDEKSTRLVEGEKVLEQHFSDVKNEVNSSSGLENLSASVNVEEYEISSSISPRGVSVLERESPVALPLGKRWATSSPSVDLSGKWKLVVDEKFKLQYDEYLKSLGQPAIVRSIAVSIVEFTSEQLTQNNEGRDLVIHGTNLRGTWERTLVASGSESGGDHLGQDFKHKRVPTLTADKEQVEAEAWWENGGTEHVSWMLGGKKFGGGDFESRRYLVDDGKGLICKSVFHPKDKKSEDATISWKFKRIDA